MAGAVRAGTPCSTDAKAAWMSPETKSVRPPLRSRSAVNSSRRLSGKPSHWSTLK